MTSTPTRAKQPNYEVAGLHHSCIADPQWRGRQQRKALSTMVFDRSDTYLVLVLVRNTNSWNAV